jgi:hypothetical protein
MTDRRAGSLDTRRQFVVRLGFLALACFVQASDADAQDVSVKPYSVGAVLVGNVVLGAAIAAFGHIGNHTGVMQAAFKGGAAGAVVFAGKWIVSRNNTPANLLGREIAAAGSSGVSNASAGNDLLQFITLVYGPVRLHITTGKNFKIRPKLDIASSIELVRAARTHQISFDRRRSLTDGVPVFEVDSAKRTGGLGASHEGGVVRFRAKTPTQIVAPDILERVIGHELVHVVQYDFVFSAIAEPLETDLLNEIPGGSAIHRYVDLGLNVPLLSILNSAIPYVSRPWEREARTLANW